MTSPGNNNKNPGCDTLYSTNNLVFSTRKCKGR